MGTLVMIGLPRGMVPMGLINRATQQIMARAAARRRRYRAIDDAAGRLRSEVRERFSALKEELS